MKNDKHEFYESKWWVVFTAFLCSFFIIIFPIYLRGNSVDWVTRLTFFWIGCWCLWWLVLSLKEIFFKKEPYIVIDELRIKYKEKSMLRLFMNTGKTQAFLWNEIKSVSWIYPYVRLGIFKLPLRIRNGIKWKRALRLDLRNGQEKWLFTHTLSQKDEQLLLDTIRKYKKIQAEEKSKFFIR